MVGVPGPYQLHPNRSTVPHACRQQQDEQQTLKSFGGRWKARHDWETQVLGSMCSTTANRVVVARACVRMYNATPNRPTISFVMDPAFGSYCSIC